MTFRFIHSSDLHLGRRFGNIPQPPDGNIRGRLMEARHNSIVRLAETARSRGAGHVLLAGDTFDTPTPSQSVLRQSLSAMGAADDVHWWILPGNHDNLQDAEPLWETIGREAPANVHAVTDPAPINLEPVVSLLPSPVSYRSAGRDLTDNLASMPSADGALRIGLAHGGVVDFTDGRANIPPDRDRSARLDYLALGDWHGRTAITPRTHYSGSPEQDRFKHGRRGVCLVVTIDGPGAIPLVEEVETGNFLWAQSELPLLAESNAADALEAMLPQNNRRDLLMRIRATGWSSLSGQSELKRTANRLGPGFAHFELDTAQLSTIYETADLDEIDKAGALRLAANELMEAAKSDALSSDDRSVAAAALSRLYAYVKETDQ